MKKRILSLIILMSMCFNMFAVTEYSAAEVQEKHTGYKQRVKVELEGVKETSDDFNIGYKSYNSMKWDKCTNNYFYDQLNDNQKQFYDDLYDMCMTYLTTTCDATEYSEDTGFSDTVFTPEGMDQTETNMVLNAFLCNNPQFYFINEYYSFGSVGNQCFAAVGIYNAYIDGEDRMEVTNELSAEIDQWMAIINQEKTVLAKEKKIHDLIVANTTYGHGTYDQSCVSTFLDEMTVCTGYAEAFHLLCNKAGITVITVTSTCHMWNMIQLFGEWYVVDCTWDDPVNANPNYIGYSYFNVNDEVIDDEDHIIEDVWDGLTIPTCDNDEVVEKTSYWDGNKYLKDGVMQSNVFLAPTKDNPSVSWYYFAYSSDDENAGTYAYEMRTGWLRDEKTGKLHFAFPENGLLMANMWSSDRKYYFDGLDLAIGKFVADDGYTYFSYSENATINGQKVTGIVQSGWVMDEQTGDLYYCFPENNRMAMGIQLGNYIFDDNGKCLNP